MFKVDLEKAEEPEIKLPTFVGSLKKQEGSRKISTSALLTTPKPLTLWTTTNWKIQEMGIPDHLTCLLRNVYASQEATVRTGHGTTDWFQTGKEKCWQQFIFLDSRGLKKHGASLVVQLVENLPAMQETLVRFLGQEDPLEEGMATQSSILAW